MIFFVFVFVISALFDFVQPASLVPPASPVSKVSHQLENTLSSGFKLYLGVCTVQSHCTLGCCTAQTCLVLSNVQLRGLLRARQNYTSYFQSVITSAPPGIICNHLLLEASSPTLCIISNHFIVLGHQHQQSPCGIIITKHQLLSISSAITSSFLVIIICNHLLEASHVKLLIQDNSQQ